MARLKGSRLATGDSFPDMQVKTTAGPMSLPGDLRGKWSIVLLYRGDW
jgi:peroxiredoxin